MKSLLDKNANIISNETIDFCSKNFQPNTPSGHPYQIVGFYEYSVVGPPPNPQAGIINPRFQNKASGTMEIANAKIKMKKILIDAKKPKKPKIKIPEIKEIKIPDLPPEPKLNDYKITFKFIDSVLPKGDLRYNLPDNPKDEDIKLYLKSLSYDYPNIKLPDDPNDQDIKDTSNKFIYEAKLKLPKIPKIPDRPSQPKQKQLGNIKPNIKSKIVNKKIGSIKKRSEKSLNLDLANTIKEIYLQMLIINTADTIIKRKNIPPIRLPMSTLKSIAKSIVSKCDIGDNENNKGFKDFLETIILSILRIVNF